LTIAQSEDSCVVYGMPRAAIERGFVTRVVSLEAMANTLQVQSMPEHARARAASGDSGGKVQ
jgi:two-component system chemotaxis response regulator CheB